MKTIIKRANNDDIKKDDLAEAGEILRKGGLVAFPTETVYGLGANAFDSEASGKIYSAKGRPSDNPLIIHIADINMVNDIAENISIEAKRLMEKFWPGPLTIVFKKKEKVPYETTGGLDTVAVRMPSHQIARKIIESAGVPIAAPSANKSGRPSPTKVEHVIDDLNGRIEMIIDGGQVGIGIESTIIDMSDKTPMILRPGFITKTMIEEEIGTVLVDKVVTARSINDLEDESYVPKAPGMKYRHYAPKADLTMFEGSIENVTKKINDLVLQDIKQGKKAGIICTDETLHCYNSGLIVSVGSRDNNDTIAHNLYSVLRDFDKTDVEKIYSETFFDSNLGQAIMNRMIKAAGYKVEKV